MNRTWTATLLLALAAAPAGAVDIELLSRIAPGLESATASGGSHAAAISADGRYVVFLSEAVNLVPGMTNPVPGPQVFLYDRATGSSTLVSRSADSDRVGGNGEAWEARISANGRFVVFASQANDLVPGQEDARDTLDIFLWDRVTGATELVSRADGSRTQTGDGWSREPVLSTDGRFVAFTSDATDLVDGIESQSPFQYPDVYVWDRRTGDVLPVSRSASDPRRMADNSSYLPSINANGRYVAFVSDATDLVAGQTERNTVSDIFLWDRTTGRTVLVSHAAASPVATGLAGNANRLVRYGGQVSADGRFVAFTSDATDLVRGQRGSRTALPNVFLWSRETGQIALVSHTFNSAVTAAGSGDHDTDAMWISSDGSWVLYSSYAANLVRGQTAGSLNAVLYSRATGKNVLVSRPSKFHRAAPTGLSADGAWATYSTSDERQVPGAVDTNRRNDAFLFERRTGKVTLLSFSTASPTRAAGGDSGMGTPLLSADGRWVAFTTEATDLVAGVRDANHNRDVVLQSRNGEREIVSLHAEGQASASPPGTSLTQSIDASGRFVLFTSTADAGLLVPGARDVNRVEDLFLYDRQLDTIQLLTRSATTPSNTADSDVGGSLEGRVSADGRWVAFTSNAKDIVPPTFGRTLVNRVFLWDRTTGQILQVSRGNRNARNPEVSSDGSVVVFESLGFEIPDQVENSAGVTSDIFLFDRATATNLLVSRAAGFETTTANGHSTGPRVSADGRIVAYTSEATNLVAGSADPGSQDVFLFDRATATTTLVSRTAASPLTAGQGVLRDLSDDGRFVLFESRAQNLVPGQNDPSYTSDLFLYDRVAGTTVLVTHTPGSATTAAGTDVGIFSGELSANGRFAAFSSMATNLVPGQVDTPGSFDVFVFDRETGTIEMISRAAGTVATAGSGGADHPVISADGRRVSFLSDRQDLVAGQSGPRVGLQLFLHDRTTGTTTLVSHSLTSPTRTGDGGSGLHVLSAAGTVVAFTSRASDLVPRDFNRNVGLLPDAFAAVLP